MILLYITVTFTKAKPEQKDNIDKKQNKNLYMG